MDDDEWRVQRAVALVRLFRSGDVEESEDSARLDELMRLIPCPRWGDLLFYQDPELSDLEVVRAALAYRPFAL
jgi:hypothetical protein